MWWLGRSRISYGLRGEPTSSPRCPRIRGAAASRAGALLISGEAGVGKTALARAACSGAESKVDVLWGSCLPLTSLAVPFLPLTTALRQWTADHAEPVSLLRPSGETGSGDGPFEFDSWLASLCGRWPVVLVVDDLHWADQSTLDLLMYVVAGLADRRLAVLATIRSGEVTENHPLRRWLADVRRLPGVSELRLDRLDRAATGEQLTGLLGGPPHEALVDQIYARTDGNAYLTTLLARGLPPDARSLPADLPTELGDAATRAWRSLSSPAQALTRLIAVAGRPQRSDQLGKVAALTGLTGDVVLLLREAVDGAVLHLGASETYWFVHPLLAEVLEAGLLPEERRALHRAFVEALDGYSVSPDAVDIERVVDLADHHDRAGHREEAYRWALLGSEAAGRAGGAKEMLRLLRRAFDLWPEVPNAEPSCLDLLQRIRRAADQAGAQEEELTAVDDLLGLVGRERDPLTAAELTSSLRSSPASWDYRSTRCVQRWLLSPATPRARSPLPWPASREKEYRRDFLSGCSPSLRGPPPMRHRRLAIGARTPAGPLPGCPACTADIPGSSPTGKGMGRCTNCSCAPCRRCTTPRCYGARPIQELLQRGAMLPQRAATRNWPGMRPTRAGGRRRHCCKTGPLVGRGSSSCGERVSSQRTWRRRRCSLTCGRSRAPPGCR